MERMEGIVSISPEMLINEQRRIPLEIVRGAERISLTSEELEENYTLYRNELLDLAQSLCFVEYVEILLEITLMLPDNTGVFKVAGTEDVIPASNKILRKNGLLGDFNQFDVPPYDPDVIENAFNLMCVLTYQLNGEYQMLLAKEATINMIASRRSIFARNPHGYALDLQTVLLKYGEYSQNLLETSRNQVFANAQLMINISSGEPEDMFIARDEIGLGLAVTDNEIAAERIVTEYASIPTLNETAFEIEQGVVVRGDPIVVQENVVTEITPEVSELTREHIASLALPEAGTTNLISPLAQSTGKARPFVVSVNPVTDYYYQSVRHAGIVPPINGIDQATMTALWNLVSNIIVSFSLETYLIRSEEYMKMQKQIIRNTKALAPNGITNFQDRSYITLVNGSNGSISVEFRLTKDDSADKLLFESFMERNVKQALLRYESASQSDKKYYYSFEHAQLNTLVNNLMEMSEPNGYVIVTAFTIPYSQKIIPHDTKLLNMIQRIFLDGYRLYVADKCLALVTNTASGQSSFVMLIQRNKLVKIIKKWSKMPSMESGYTNVNWRGLLDLEKRLKLFTIFRLYSFMITDSAMHAEQYGYIDRLTDVHVVIEKYLKDQKTTVTQIFRYTKSMYAKSEVYVGGKTIPDVVMMLSNCRRLFATNFLLNMAHRGSFGYVMMKREEYIDNVAHDNYESNEGVFEYGADGVFYFMKRNNKWIILEIMLVNRTRSKPTDAFIEVETLLESTGHVKQYTSTATAFSRIYQFHGFNITMKLMHVEERHIEVVVRALLDHRPKDSDIKPLISYYMGGAEVSINNGFLYQNITQSIHVRRCEFYGSKQLHTIKMTSFVSDKPCIIQYIGIDELLTDTYNTAVLKYIKGELMSDMYLSNIHSSNNQSAETASKTVYTTMSFYDQVWKFGRKKSHSYTRRNTKIPNLIDIGSLTPHSLTGYLISIGCLNISVMNKPRGGDIPVNTDLEQYKYITDMLALSDSSKFSFFFLFAIIEQCKYGHMEVKKNMYQGHKRGLKIKSGITCHKEVNRCVLFVLLGVGFFLMTL